MTSSYYPSLSSNNSTTSTTVITPQSISQPYEFRDIKQFRILLSKHIEITSLHHDWPIFLGKIFGSDPKGIIKICTEEEINELLLQLNSQSDCFRFLMSHFSNTQNLYHFPMDRVPKSLTYKLLLKLQQQQQQKVHQQYISPNIINGFDINDNKRFITVNIFQLYFFAFGLYGDYWSSNTNQRSIFGVPTYTYQSSSSNLGSSRSGLTNSTSSKSTLSPERQKNFFIRLLNDYLNHFLPIPRGNVSTNQSSTNKMMYNQTQTHTFFKIICECFMGNNITNLMLSKVPQEYFNLFSNYKKPNILNADASIAVLTHFQEFVKTQTESMFITQLYNTLRYPLFMNIISFFEKFDPNDSQLPLEQTIRLWLSFLTPWRQTTLKKKPSLLSFNNNDSHVQISEKYIIDNYYFYSYIFSLFILKALLSFDFSLELHHRAFLKVLDTFLDPNILQCLRNIDQHDKHLLNNKSIDYNLSNNSDNLSKEILQNLEKQINFFDIKENQDRLSMFSNYMSMSVKKMVEDLAKKSIGIKIKESIFNRLSMLYQFEVLPEIVKAAEQQQQQHQSLSTSLHHRNSMYSTSSSTMGAKSPLLSLSPNRNSNGCLTEEGRKQLYNGSKLCTVYDTYSYPLSFEKFPITSHEISLPIKIVYRLTDNTQIRLMSRRFFRKEIILLTSIGIIILLIILKFLLWLLR